MPYTVSRLQYTLDVYREAKIRDLASGPSRTVQRHLRNDYSLRQVAPSLTIKNALGGWLEDDSSADEYDPKPSKKRPSTAHVCKTPKKLKRVHTQQPSPQTIQQEDTDLPSLFVTLRLKSDSAKKVLRDLAKEHGTGYNSEAAKHEQSSVRSDQQSGLLYFPSEEGQNDPHGEATGTYLHKLDEDSRKIDNSDGRVLRSRKIPDKEVSAQPLKCVACKAAKKRCSLSSGRTRLPPCAQCLQNWVKCVVDLPNAEPQIDSDRPVKLPDVPQSQDPPQQNSSRPQSGGDSAVTRGPVPTASQVVRSLVSPRRYPFITHIGTSGEKENPIFLDSPPSSPGARAAPPSSTTHSTGRVVRISTFWAHPIDFKHCVTPELPCHFCSDFRYGIYGYGEKTVNVIQYPNSLKYEETGDGHRADDEEATRMCVNCALNRLYISRCNAHGFERFVALQDAHLVKYRDQVIAKTWSPRLKNGAYVTCSICPKAAVWRCRADQQFDKVLRPLTAEQGRGRGCGLVLCHDCWAGVALTGTLSRPTKGPSRADADFLFAGSMLHQAYSEHPLDCSADV